MSRREYDLHIVFNGVEIKKVIIDPHYEGKHAGSINDELVLELVRALDRKLIDPDKITGDFSYFKQEIEFNRKFYRLIWLLEKNKIYIGVVNAYRR